MRLLSITPTNFRQFEAAQVAFPRDGIAGIIGINGHGKTTLIEAAAWALYGTDAARGGKASIRWTGATSRRQAAVDLVFELAGQRYHLFRSESDAVLEAVHDGFETVLARGTTAVTGHVGQLLGLSLAEFRSSYLTEQKQLARIAGMRPLERQQFVRSVLGLERLDAALKRLREAKNAIGHEVDGLRGGLGEREPLSADLDAAEAAVTQRTAEVGTARETLQQSEFGLALATEALHESDRRRLRFEDLTRQGGAADADATGASQQIESLGTEIDRGHVARARLIEQEAKLARLPALRAERESLRVAEARAGERRQLQERIGQHATRVRENEAEQATAAAVIAGHDAPALARLLADHRTTRARLETLRTGRMARLHAAKHDVTAAHVASTEVRAQIDALEQVGRDGECPVCTQALGVHFDGVLAKLRTEADDLANRQIAAGARVMEHEQPTDAELAAEVDLESIAEAGNRARQAETLAAQATQRLAALRTQLGLISIDLGRMEAALATLPDARPDPERLTAATGEITTLETLDRSLGEDRITAGRLQLLLTQRDERQGRRRAALDLRTAVDAALAELAFDAGVHTGIRDTAESARTATEAAAVTLARAEQSAEDAHRWVERAERTVAEYDRRAASLRTAEANLARHERAADALNRFRLAAAATIRPELEELLSGFVALLTDGRYEAASLSETFDVTLYQSGVPVEVLSGGEEDVVALALRIALSRMIADRAGHPLELLILDEPFGSLDAVRRQNVLALIRRLSGTFAQVIVISHVDETREAVDHAIEVTFDESTGRSTVRQAPVERAEVVAA